jgi:hypothetical protein
VRGERCWEGGGARGQGARGEGGGVEECARAKVRELSESETRRQTYRDILAEFYD